MCIRDRFHRSDAGITCPDGHVQPLDFDDPLRTLGQIVQEDICLLQKRGDEHVLTGAVLCFPASWRLADKAGRPLIGIHDTVPEYDSDIARRRRSTNAKSKKERTANGSGSDANVRRTQDASTK